MWWIKKIILAMFVLFVSSQTLAQTAESFSLQAPLLNNIGLSIVRITTPTQLGLGFIVNEHGYILTNSYILASANQIKVTLPDERKMPAKLIYNDEHHGVALLYIQNNHLIPAVLGDSDLVHDGDSIWLYNSCLGIGQTLSRGLITAKKNLFYKLADMNPQDSGGPLINDQGQVIAINTALDFGAGPGIHFAIPINSAKSLMTLVNKDEKNSKQLIADLKQANQGGERYE